MTSLTNFTVNDQLTIMDASLNVIEPLSSENYEYYKIYTLGTYTITPNYNIDILYYVLTGAGGDG
jgi:hypothetical protein